MRAELQRTCDNGTQTIGRLILTKAETGEKVFVCHTLELPWKGNEQQVSCIPPGVYDVVPRRSPKYGKHFHVTNVPGRSWILIHGGNYYTQIRGCILPGESLADINADGEKDVLASKNTLAEMLDVAPDGFLLEIHAP